MVLSDRIAVMSSGVVQQFAEPMTVYRQPANLFVASFIGSPQMNFLPGGKAPGAWGESRVVGVRPHDLAPTNQMGAADFSLSGELALIEPAGPVHYLDVQIGDQMVKATCVDPAGLAPGCSVRLAAPGHAIHLFDRESGARVAA
jgi:ABC-type sugar transport system ATPase subunit